MQKSRNLGGLVFVWLRDRTGIVQVGLAVLAEGEVVNVRDLVVVVGVSVVLGVSGGGVFDIAVVVGASVVVVV